MAKKIRSVSEIRESAGKPVKLSEAELRALARELARLQKEERPPTSRENKISRLLGL